MDCENVWKLAPFDSTPVLPVILEQSTQPLHRQKALQPRVLISMPNKETNIRIVAFVAGSCMHNGP